MKKMTKEVIDTLYTQGKLVYENKTSLSDATDLILDNYSDHIAKGSARFYIKLYSDFVSGKTVSWNMNGELVAYYIDRILEEKGVDEGKPAFESAYGFAISKSNKSLIQNLEKVKEKYTTGADCILSDKETIGCIKSCINFRNFTYPDNLIENFYLSLKSKPFTILAGTSGTGKTRLVKLFAEAINAKYKMVPVRPDWSDSSDLFGHVDLNGQFVPGAVLEFIAKAQADSGKPYILCLDEMNLARVEYYLSDFLSVIETREMVDGKIVSDPLVTAEKYGADSAAMSKYGEIRFPQNLYLVGTVNMDETTFPFSKKVLDRANTIEFDYVDLSSVQNTDATKADPITAPNSFLETSYLFLKQCMDEDPDYVKGVCAELQKINAVLQKANAHVGYRVRDEIVFYLMNNKKAGLLSDDEALDNEIMQKILPRIQGSSVSVKDMLCELFKILAGDYEGYQTKNNDVAVKMKEKLNDKGANVKYPKSARKVAFMVRRFEEDGFTSYWL